ncbi:MAG: hypothetical protein AABX00_07020 [Nanoarchaeota archaeon]
MEIDVFVLIIDILGSAGLGFAFSNKIVKDLRTVAGVAGAVPLIMFSLKTVTVAASGDSAFADLLSQQIITLIYGYIGGAISSLISALITQAVKNVRGIFLTLV